MNYLRLTRISPFLKLPIELVIEIPSFISFEEDLAKKLAKRDLHIENELWFDRISPEVKLVKKIIQPGEEGHSVMGLDKFAKDTVRLLKNSNAENMTPPYFYIHNIENMMDMQLERYLNVGVELHSVLLPEDFFQEFHSYFIHKLQENEDTFDFISDQTSPLNLYRQANFPSGNVKLKIPLHFSGTAPTMRRLIDTVIDQSKNLPYHILSIFEEYDKKMYNRVLGSATYKLNLG